MDNIQVTYHGHACFSLETDDFRIVIDPYDDHVPGYQSLHLDADMVVCSHEHADHNYREGVSLRKGKKNPFEIRTMEVDHDDAHGTLRGQTLIHIFSCVGMKVVHFGDIGRALTKEEQMTVKNADCVMIPVGGTYTIDGKAAAQMAKDICPRVVIPMHYKRGNLGLEAIDTLDLFLEHTENVMIYHDNTLLLDKETKQQVAVLEYHSK